MNYLMSILTCKRPLHVMGKEHYSRQDQKGGINKKGGHWARRQECMNGFEKIVGYFPLVQ